MYALFSVYSVCSVYGVYGMYGMVPDWKVCIAQPISRLRNFGTSAGPDAQILKILLSDAQFENAARRKNDITQLFRVVRGKMYYAIF